METNADALSSLGNGGGLSQLTKPMSPDLEQLTRDFRAFVADCETLLKNATTLSGSGATVARRSFRTRCRLRRSSSTPCA